MLCPTGFNGEIIAKLRPSKDFRTFLAKTSAKTSENLLTFLANLEASGLTKYELGDFIESFSRRVLQEGRLEICD